MSTVLIRRTTPLARSVRPGRPAGRIVPVVLMFGALVSAPAPALAEPVCHPAPYQASAGATLIRLGLLDLRPLGVSLPPLLDARVATAHSAVDTTKPVITTAEAHYADAKVLGMSALPAAPAKQAAPPENGTPATAKLPALNAAGLATVNLAESSAAAKWKPGFGCGEPASLGHARTQVAEATVLPGGTPALPLLETLLGSLRPAPLVKAGVASAEARTSTVNVHGRTAVAAQASTGLAEVSLLGQITVRVLHQPSLTVVSTGDVQYTAPLLEVVLPGGQVQRIGTPDVSVDATVPAKLGPGTPGLVSIRVSTVALSKETSPAGAVRAEAVTIRVQVTAAGATVADLGIGLLSGTVTAPGQQGKPTPTPQATSTPHVPSIEPTFGGTPSQRPAGGSAGGTKEKPSGSDTVLLASDGDSEPQAKGLPVTGPWLAGYVIGALFLAGGGFLLYRLSRKQVEFDA